VIYIKCRREKVEKNILGWNNNMRAQVEKAKHPNSTELANSCIFFEKRSPRSLSSYRVCRVCCVTGAKVITVIIAVTC
jgi:hypothetical protein